jgi:hypothetical protein
MRVPSISDRMLRAGAIHWLSRTQPVAAGPSLGEFGFLRGFFDDFLGDSLDARWNPRTEAAARSSINLLAASHGGLAELLTGNVANDFARLDLGATVPAYTTDNLAVDPGFKLYVRCRLSSVAGILADVFSITTIGVVDYHIHFQADSTISGNWELRLNDGLGGPDLFVDSGVAYDTLWHEHSLEASPGLVQHYLDGELINEATTNIPAVAMTACFRCLARAASSKYLRMDYAYVLPRNN